VAVSSGAQAEVSAGECGRQAGAGPHALADSEQAGPDRCRLTLGSWSWTSLAAAVARFDAEIEVVGPDELINAFVRLSERFTRATAGHSARSPSTRGPSV
jgi:hypothetical protein